MHSFLKNNIASVLYAQRKLAEAMKLYQEVLRVRVATLGPEHLDVAATYNKYDLFFFICGHSCLIFDVACSIGNMFKKMGKPEEAIKNYNESLEIKIRVVGHDHPDVAITYTKYDPEFFLF